MNQGDLRRVSKSGFDNTKLACLSNKLPAQLPIADSHNIVQEYQII
jgi:hypothetical protein